MKPRRAQWPRAAIFDCDGLLIDSLGCWHRAYADIARVSGCRLDGADLRALNGASVPDAANRLGTHLRVPISAHTLRAALKRAFVDTPPTALPGAYKLTERLARRMPIAVASNAPRELIELALRAAKLDSSFSAIVSAEDTAAFKPEPHVYLEACRRLGVAPSDAIAFEDSHSGARAARRAGLALVGVPSIDSQHLDADLVVPGLDDARLETLLGLT